MNGKLLRIESCCKRKTRNGYKNKKGDSFMRLRQEIKAFLMDEEAIGTVEVVLLLVGNINPLSLSGYKVYRVKICR